MASKQMYGVLAMIILTVLPDIALAKEFVVGDDKGWTINFDYKAWAADKYFRVGDKLVFKYPEKAHNVFKLNDSTAFQNCVVPPPNEALTTGNDVITLTSPGKKWYICGVGKHCVDGGQKLAITVEAALEGPAPSPTPSGGDGLTPGGPTPSPTPSGGDGLTPGAPTPSSANGVLPSGYHALLAVIALIAMVVMV